MRNRRPLAALVILAVVAAAFAVRWEEWDYRDGAGQPVFRYRGLLLPWQEAQAPPAAAGVAVTVHKRTLLGLNRSDYDGPPGQAPGGPGYAARAAGR